MIKDVIEDIRKDYPTISRGYIEQEAFTFLQHNDVCGLRKFLQFLCSESSLSNVEIRGN